MSTTDGMASNDDLVAPPQERQPTAPGRDREDQERRVVETARGRVPAPDDFPKDPPSVDLVPVVEQIEADETGDAKVDVATRVLAEEYGGGLDYFSQGVLHALRVVEAAAEVDRAARHAEEDPDA